MSRRWILFLIFFFILSGCKSNPVPSLSTEIPPSIVADTTIDGAKVICTRGNIKEWELKAGTIEVYEGKNILQIKELQLDFFENAHPVSEVKSERGEIDLLTNNAEIEGNVVITSVDGSKRIETEYLQWRSGEQKFVTNRQVKLLLGESVFTGESLEADLALETVKIQGLNAQGTLEEIPRP